MQQCLGEEEGDYCRPLRAWCRAQRGYTQYGGDRMICARDLQRQVQTVAQLQRVHSVSHVEA